MTDIFDDNAEYEVTEYGHEIRCKKGLWGVTAPTKEEAMNEASHYYWQYREDGEYD